MKGMRLTIDDNKSLERAKLIAALRYCASGENCKGCPLGQYDGITCAGFSDMLRKAAYLLERDAEPPNDPLTLEELRGMDGEPVYAVPLGHISARKPHWVIVDLSTPQFLLHYGKTWLAYRRKPDGGQ